ncbi:hypothetical protein QBC38DRAFT_514249 [Podospora fimiseda]|uniref:Ankyrin n=1 Tax=Podospora fimiseda TaxID=252190 RepID=A0AAN7H653_9PEZI|nr:hypothetical protein QBC38DRAFT_514249 [Podospora fimiseda]
MFTAALVITWWAQPVFASSDGDDFANNLFSDLVYRSIARTFGERVAIQYLSHTTSWQECVIFACAPLGLLTAVVSAIRVGGPRWLKAIVGRARETDATVELELLSSTSPDVCELWNGVGMVRIVGTPSIVQLAYGIPSYTPSGTTAVHTLESAKEQGLFTEVNNKIKVSNNSNEFDPTDKEGGGSQICTENPPNILLNVTNGTVRSWELYLAMFLGLAIQFGVLIYDGFLVSSPLPWLDKDVPRYALTLTTVGTVTMCVGTGLCALIVESRTVEEVWKAEYGADSGTKRWQDLPSIVWIQRGKVVADQVFRSFKIMGNRSSREKVLRTSRKNPNPVLTESWAVIASTMAMTGFVLQFCGLRSMPWSASIAQLVATVLMIFIRILIHGRITMMPKAEELPEGHELDQLAKDIHDCSWRITMPSRKSDAEVDPEENVGKYTKFKPHSGSQILETRIRLAHLTAWPSRPDSAEMAKRICVATEDILRQLYLSQNGPIALKSSAKSIESFDWELGVLLNPQFSDYYEAQGKLTVTFTRSNVDGRWTEWRADANKVDALLSLWLSNFVTASTGEKESQRTFWVLGRNDTTHERSIYDWWVDRGESRVFEFTNLRESCWEHSVDVTRVFDLSGWEVTTSSGDDTSRFGIVTHGSVIAACGTLLIGSFFRCVATKLFDTTMTKMNGKAIVMPAEKVKDGATQFLITHQGVRIHAEILQQTGLATVSESYRLVVPVLQEIGILPKSYDVRTLPESYDETLIESMPDVTSLPQPSTFSQLRLAHVCKTRVKRLTSEDRWADAGKVLRQLLKITTKAPDSQWNQQEAPFVQHIRESTGESVVEFTKELATQLLDSSSLNFPDDDVKARLLSDVFSELTLYSGANVSGKLSKLCTNAAKSGEMGNLDPENLLASVIKLDDLNIARLVMFLVDISTTTYRDLIYSWSNDTSHNDDKIRLLVRNFKGVQGNRTSIFREAYEKADLRVLDALLIDGFNMLEDSVLGLPPLVAACKDEGKYPDRDGVIRTFLKHGAKASDRCEFGQTALHYATKKGYLDLVKILVIEGKTPQTVTSALNRTPLHLACIHNHLEVVEWLLEQWSDGVNTTDNEKMTPLHLAAFCLESRETIMRVLIERGSDISALNGYGQTPLLLAAFRGQEEAIKLLILMGASIHHTDTLGRSALHYAAMEDSKNYVQKALGSVRLLVDELAAIDAADNEGWTPLHYAYCTARSGDCKTADFLLTIGANPHSQDKRGRAPEFYKGSGVFIPYWSPALESLSR